MAANLPHEVASLSVVIKIDTNGEAGIVSGNLADELANARKEEKDNAPMHRRSDQPRPWRWTGSTQRRAVLGP